MILYQEQIRVPFIMKGPGIPAGRRVDALVRTIDILPTIIELTKMPQGELPAMDGSSLVGLLRGIGGSPGPAYAEALGVVSTTTAWGWTDTQSDRLFSLMDAEWKLILNASRPNADQLFHLADDPREERNVLSRFPGEYERLHRELTARAVPPREADGSGMTPEDAERLRSLGYVR